MLKHTNILIRRLLQEAHNLDISYQRVILTIWWLRNSRKYAFYKEINEVLKNTFAGNELPRALRRLQDQGYIDSRSDGYHIYPAGFDVVKQYIKKHGTPKLGRPD